MKTDNHTEALSVISDAVAEDHDGLVQFTRKLSSIDQAPSFWWRDQPVWLTKFASEQFHAWPLKRKCHSQLSILSADGLLEYTFNTDAFAADIASRFRQPLSRAELALFIDLASGFSLEKSAHQSNVAITTRRKQLQSCFRKLTVASQSEMISMANRLVERLAARLGKRHAQTEESWSSYLPYLPTNARCGVIEAPQRRAVRYIEMGPVYGKPVLVLHPIVFPTLDDEDDKLCQHLGIRMIWPLRPGCLAIQGVVPMKWEEHCSDVVEDLHTIQSMCIGHATPIIALVSSGAYASRFAARYPAAVSQIDFVSTCFSAGKRPTRDAYFGDYLLRQLRQNARIANVAIQHLAAAALKADRFEKTFRRVFRGSDPDQFLLDQEFQEPHRRERLEFAIRHSVDSMRFDYLSQLRFDWREAQKLSLSLMFWHGVEDTVHSFDDLNRLAQQISGKPAKAVRGMGHLTQGASFRQAVEQIAKTYPI